MSRIPKLLIAFCLTILALLGSAAVANASSANSGQNCMIVIKRIPGQGNKTRVVSDECSYSKLSVPAGNTLLITFYENINFGGRPEGVSTPDGPCDAVGYGLPDLSGLNGRVGGITSYISSGNCYDQTYYYDREFGGTSQFNLYDNPWVGNPWNDHLLSMELKAI